MDEYKLGFLIPVYNHGSTLMEVVTSLIPFDCPVIVVDDGNNKENALLINKVIETYKDNKVYLVTLKKNCGKGKASNEGVKKAYRLGLTHIFQLDADGQHDVSFCNSFIEKSKKNPDAVINGYPIYDETVPLARKNGREFSNNWCRVVTINPYIKDVLCGFRIYPVSSYLKAIRFPAIINKRMGYDVDILAHLSWMGVRIIDMGVKVTYPKDGISNFHVVKDNIRISLTFARLCIGMFFRFPYLLIQNYKRNKDE